MSAIRNAVLVVFLVLWSCVGALVGEAALAAAGKDTPVTPQQLIDLGREVGQLEQQVKQAEEKLKNADKARLEARDAKAKADADASAKRRNAQEAKDSFLKQRAELEKKLAERTITEAEFKAEEDKLVNAWKAADKADSDAQAAADASKEKCDRTEESWNNAKDAAAKRKKELDAKNKEIEQAKTALAGPKPIAVRIAALSADPLGSRLVSGTYYAPADTPVSVEVGGLEPGDRVRVFVNNEQRGGEANSTGDRVGVVLGKCDVGRYSLSADVVRGERRAGSTAELHVIARPPQPKITAVVERDQRLAPLGNIYHVLGRKFSLEVQVDNASPGDSAAVCADDIGELKSTATLYPNLMARVPVTLERGGTLTLRAHIIRFGIQGPPSGPITVVVPLEPTPADKEGKKAAGGGGKNTAEAKTLDDRTVMRVVPRKDKDPCRGSLPKRPVGEVAFKGPAHFPRPAFGWCGEPVEQQGAIIYEGMRFSREKSGQYHVDFVVGIPAVPTTLRLQLKFRSECDKTWRTLTLPPVEIAPSSDSFGKYQPGIFQVHCDGYSEVLRDLKGKGEIVREGVARFGFGSAL